MKDAVSILGWKVKDKVTGFTGVATHVGLDLFGCVQVIVRPPVFLEKDTKVQKMADSDWFDISRLDKVGKSPVMNPIPQKGTDLVAGCDSSKPLK